MGRVRSVASRAIAVLEAIERVACVALLATIFVAVLVQIVYRYVLRNPLVWTDELARYSLIWLTFVAAAFVMARNRHIAVHILTKLLGPRVVRIISFVALVLVALACVWATTLTWETFQRWSQRTSTALQLPMSVVMAAPLVGFGLMAFHSVANAVRTAVGKEEIDVARESTAPEAEEVVL